MRAYHVRWRYHGELTYHEDTVWARNASHARQLFDAGHNEQIIRVYQR